MALTQALSPTPQFAAAALSHPVNTKPDGPQGTLAAVHPAHSAPTSPEISG